MNPRSIITGFVVLVLFLGILNVGADTPKLWDKTVGGNSNDDVAGVAVDIENNVIITGDTLSFGAGSWDFWTVKYDSNGNLLWNKSSGGSDNDYGKGVVVDPANNILVAGSTYSFGAGSWDFWTVKYDSNGNLLWNRTAGGSYADDVGGVAVDSNRNIIVVGGTQSFGVGGVDVWTIKYRTDGIVLWNKTLGGASTDSGNAVAVDSSNNIVVAGLTYSFGAGLADVWVIKYDSYGNLLWNRTAGGSSVDVGYGVAVDSGNNVIVTGYTISFGAGQSDFWTVKYDSNGNLLWNRTAGGSIGDQGYAVSVDSRDNIIVTGSMASFARSGSDVWILKYDSSGNLLWNKTIGGDFNDEGRSVAVDSEGNLIVAGILYPYTSGVGSDFWVTKYGAPLCDDGIDNDDNGVSDCEDAECANVPVCRVQNRLFTPQPTIVTLQGKLTNSSSGAGVSTASMRVTLSNSTGGQVWFDSFSNVLVDGVFNIPLGASKPLSLVKDTVYSAVVEVDVGSATFSAADVVFGDNNPAGDLIKFTA